MVSDKLKTKLFIDFFDGLIINFPLNLRKVQPSISNPSFMCVIKVFSSDNSKPRTLRKSRIILFAFSAISFVAAVTMKQMSDFDFNVCV